jgi:hypothetical protein
MTENKLQEIYSNMLNKYPTAREKYALRDFYYAIQDELLKTNK